MKLQFVWLVLALVFWPFAPAVHSSVIPSPPGSFDPAANTVLIVHSNATTTEYAAVADTNASRGTAFKTALAASVAGDTIFLPAKTFDIGDDNYLQIVADTNWIGSSKESTIIRSGGTIANPGNNIVNLANNIVIANLTIQATAAENLIQIPVGVKAANPDVNAVFFNVKIIGKNDGVYLADTGGTVNIVGFNVDVYSKWDAIYLYDYVESVHLTLIDSNVEVVAPHATSGGAVDGIILRSNTHAKFYNSSIVAKNGGYEVGEESGNTKGIYNLGSGSGTIDLYNTLVVGTSVYSNQPIYSIYNSNGITNVDPLTVYSTGTVEGTITPIAADTQINSSWDANAGTWQAYDSNIHLACTDSSGACDLIYYRLDTDSSSAISYGNWTLFDQNILVTQDGNRAIAFNGSDLNGTSQDSNIQYALVDKTAPAVSITSPTGNPSQTTNSVTIQYAGTDANSGIAKYWVRVDSDSWIDNSTNASYTFSNLADGTHVFTVIATDNADNNSSDANVTVTISSLTASNPASGWPACQSYGSTQICSAAQACQGSLVNASDTLNCCQGACTEPAEFPPGIAWKFEQDYFTPDDADIRQALARLSAADGFSGFDSQNCLELTRQFGFARAFEIFETPNGSNGSNKSTQTRIRLTIRNNSGQTQSGLLLFEQIPKSAAPHAFDVSTTHVFQVISDDPVIAFKLPGLSPDQEYAIEYTVPSVLDEKTASLFSIPVLFADFPAPRETILYSVRQIVVPMKNDLVRGIETLGLDTSSETIDETILLNGRITIRRGVTVKSVFDGNRTVVTTAIDLIVENKSNQDISDLTLTEFFPLGQPLNLAEIKSRQAFKKLDSQNAIQFSAVLLSAYQERKWSYRIEQEFSETALDRFLSPLVMGKLSPEVLPPGPDLPSSNSAGASSDNNFPLLVLILVGIALVSFAAIRLNQGQKTNRKTP